MCLREDPAVATTHPPTPPKKRTTQQNIVRKMVEGGKTGGRRGWQVDKAFMKWMADYQREPGVTQLQVLLVAQMRMGEIRSAHDSHSLEKKTKKDQSKTESFLYVGGKLNSINTQVLDATGTLINLQREKCARSTRSKSGKT